MKVGRATNIFQRSEPPTGCLTPPRSPPLTQLIVQNVPPPPFILPLLCQVCSSGHAGSWGADRPSPRAVKWADFRAELHLPVVQHATRYGPRARHAGRVQLRAACARAMCRLLQPLHLRFGRVQCVRLGQRLRWTAEHSVWRTVHGGAPMPACPAARHCVYTERCATVAVVQHANLRDGRLRRVRDHDESRMLPPTATAWQAALSANCVHTCRRRRPALQLPGARWLL